eukprot:SAG31_NODE_12584_length_931_cov_1.069712_2_plen_95_part_00
MMRWITQEGGLQDSDCEGIALGTAAGTDICMQLGGNGNDYWYDCNRADPENHMLGSVSASAEVCLDPWPVSNCGAVVGTPSLASAMGCLVRHVH